MEKTSSKCDIVIESKIRVFIKKRSVFWIRCLSGYKSRRNSARLILSLRERHPLVSVDTISLITLETVYVSPINVLSLIKYTILVYAYSLEVFRSDWRRFPFSSRLVAPTVTRSNNIRERQDSVSCAKSSSKFYR